jgi:Cu+-exporting ATPase
VEPEDMAASSRMGNLPIYNIVLQLLATPVQFYFGWKFYKGALASIRHKNANTDVLIALGTSSAYFMGMLMNILYISGFEHEDDKHYLESAHSFETSAVLISILLLG